MKDERIERMADGLLDYSVAIKPGEKLLIELFGKETPLVTALIRKAYERGALPFVSIKDYQVMREIIRATSVEYMDAWADYALHRMKAMDAYLGIRAGDNASELADVPDEAMRAYMEHYVKPVHGEERVRHTKWCIMRYPNPSMAQMAKMSTEAFEDFYFDVCCLDYSRMSRAMDPLVKIMASTDKVRLTARGTDISFSIKGQPIIKCDGKMNIPDGEVFTAPVRTSVNGVIAYNTPSLYNGTVYDNITLRFENGKIVEATCNDTAKLNRVLDTDEGARYIGEFAIGVNPLITKPMQDTLFDEKIMGSLHFTPGRAYDEADNGNRSAIHWDLVLIQTPRYGGGEMWFDDRLVRKDGRFVVPELEGLNPENLG